MAPKTHKVEALAEAEAVTTPAELLVSSNDPVLGADGRVYVNPAVSAQAVDAGYGADSQARSADASMLPPVDEKDDD